MERAYIKNIAYYVPERILDNKYFESILDTNNEWIITRTGIETRHMARADETIFEMGLNAVRNLEKKGVDLKEVSDGLSGELYTEDGWIQKFSEYDELISDEDC